MTNLFDMLRERGFVSSNYEDESLWKEDAVERLTRDGYPHHVCAHRLISTMKIICQYDQPLSRWTFDCFPDRSLPEDNQMIVVFGFSKLEDAVWFTLILPESYRYNGCSS